MAIPADMFYLEPGAEGSLQKQIQRLIAERILAGHFKPGEKLPSSRKLAAQLGVSRITITLAYTALLADDYLTSRGRSGYFVSPSAPRPPEFTLLPKHSRETVDWDRITGRRFSSVPSLRKPDDWRRYRYRFIYGQVDETLFDHQNWRLCALQALGQRDFEALTRDSFDRDDPKLVEFIARHILPRRGIVASSDNILVTLGAQNALWLVSQILLAGGGRAAVENPTYPGLREILMQVQSEIVPIDVDRDGLPPRALPSAIDVVFATPSHQCPTSTTMPLHRRRELLERATEDDFLIVEDDYEFEIPSARPPSPALKSLDADGRVLYIGSFSKSLFPGLRLGYLVGSSGFIREARALRRAILRHPPGHLQRSTAYFLSLGHYDALTRRIGQAFRQRRMVLEDAIACHGLTPAEAGGTSGSSLWMRAPDHVDTEALARDLRAQEVLIEPGAIFFCGATPAKNYYRLAISSISSDLIMEGTRRIAQMLGSMV